MILAVITREFQLLNYAESALWAVCGVVAAAVGLRQRHRGVRARCLLLAVTLLAFGGSDVAEASSGAWWEPWWLLVWKVACVLVLLALLAEYAWRRRARRPS